MESNIRISIRVEDPKMGSLSCSYRDLIASSLGILSGLPSITTLNDLRRVRRLLPVNINSG
jgi:hypothetical protein